MIRLPGMPRTGKCGLMEKVTCVASKGDGKGAYFSDLDIFMLTLHINLGLVNRSREFRKSLMPVARVSMMRNSVTQKLVLNSD